MAFKSTLTNTLKDKTKSEEPNNYMNTSTTTTSLPRSGTISAMALLTTRIEAIESELETVGKGKSGTTSKRKDNFDKNINTSLSKEDEETNSSIKEKVRSPISLETDLLRYKKHERDDSFSDSSLQLHSVSATSTCLTTPVDNLDSKFDYMKAGLSPPNTGTKTSFDEEIQVLTTKLEKQQQQHKEELEQLRKEHKTQLGKTKLDYEKSKNDQKHEFEKTIQELKNSMESMKKENKSEIDELRKGLMNQYKDSEKIIKNELSIRYESQTKELTRIHDIEKNKIITVLKSMKRLKENAEDELKEGINNLQVEKRSIRQGYVKEIEILRDEHARQLDSMKKGETKVTFMQIKNQQERRIIEGEKELQNQIEELTYELSEKKTAEKSWIKYKREKESAILDFKTRFDSLETTIRQKEAQIAELREERVHSLQEIKILNRNKENTSNMIKTFQQKTEETIKDLKRQLDAKTKTEGESERIVETLREQLNDTNEELSNLRIQLSNLESEFNQAKERCEDLESLIEDKSDIINRLQHQEKEAIALLRTKLETSHQKELQEFRDRLEEEYEIKIKKLTDQNSRLERNSVQNSEAVKELEEATRCLASAESSYKELNAKHQQFVHKNQQLSNEIVAFRSKVEKLEANNLNLKENNRLVTSEKEKVTEELKKVKDEMRRFQDESSTVSNKMIELENERDKLAGTISTVKTYWEKNHKDLQIQFQEMKSQRDKFDNELTKLKFEHSEKIKAVEELTNNVETIEKQKESLSKLLEEHQKGMQTFMKENAAAQEVWCQKEADLVSNYELELKEKDSKLEELRSKLDHTRKHSEELDELLREAQGAETKQLELSQKLEYALRECVNKDNEISNLEMFKKQSQARIDSLESSTNRLTTKLRAFETDSEQAKRNADAKINDLKNRLRDSMTEIEDLHNQVSDLKQKLIEKEATVLNHSRSSSRDGPTFDTSKLTNLTMQVATLTQKLQETNQEKNLITTKFEHSITQAKKTADELRNRIETMAIEHEKEKKQVINNHQSEIAKITGFMQSRLEALEKRQRNITNAASNDDAKKVNVLEQRLSELEKSLGESHSECDKLNEKIMQVQQKYADSITEKDKVAKEVKSLEQELQKVLAKNMDLVTRMSSFK